MGGPDRQITEETLGIWKKDLESPQDNYSALEENSCSAIGSKQKVDF